jgi:alpha-2-macroglobulin-like protein
MTQPFQDFEELRCLLDALCEERITPEEIRRLEQMILRHPEAAVYYIQYLTLYADLAACCGASAAATTIRRQ